MKFKQYRQKRQLLQEAAFFVLFFALVLCFVATTFAQEIPEDAAQFALNNPDGEKYEFVKTYLMGLEYLYQNDQAKKNMSPLSEEKFKDLNALAGEKDRLIMANVNLRIARNLIEKFDRSDNGLMLKVVQLFTRFVNDQVAFNNEERALITQIYEAVFKEQLDDSMLRLFSEGIVKINEKRKESSLELLEASTLVNKILISHQLNARGRFSQLGVSKDERQRLLGRLQMFEGEAYRGEPRAGQTFLEASIATIRQILEDQAYVSLDK
ncbi:MAG TPA: hypothetical protein VI749_03870 [Candidatus Omnitrophota bacterium]|nr:hypothetical protein [Candidatus Omnitrophota bacterium]